MRAVENRAPYDRSKLRPPATSGGRICPGQGGDPERQALRQQGAVEMREVMNASPML